MSPDTAKSHSIQQLVETIQATRDRGRVRLHLLSLDAKDRFRELEGKLATLEEKLQTGGERVAAEASVAVNEVTQAVNDLFRTAKDSEPT